MGKMNCAIRLWVIVTVGAAMALPVAGAEKSKSPAARHKGDDIQLTLSTKPYLQDPSAAYTRQLCPPGKKSADRSKKPAK